MHYLEWCTCCSLANSSRSAGKFQVPPTFLLQQAAWLYERHLDHVRIQMKKVSGSNIPTASNSGTSTLTAMGGIAMQRTGSAGSRGVHVSQFDCETLTMSQVRELLLRYLEVSKRTAPACEAAKPRPKVWNSCPWQELLHEN